MEIIEPGICIVVVATIRQRVHYSDACISASNDIAVGIIPITTNKILIGMGARSSACSSNSEHSAPSNR